MGQERTIQLLHDWLLQNRWSHCLRVKCYHTESGEELALFAGPKERGKARGCRVAETDILAFREDSRTVDLIVEVDLRPNPTPKRAISNLLPVLIADNYTARLDARLDVGCSAGHDGRRLIDTLTDGLPVSARTLS